MGKVRIGPSWLTSNLMRVARLERNVSGMLPRSLKKGVMRGEGTHPYDDISQFPRMPIPCIGKSMEGTKSRRDRVRF
jgi:hypothetical protein